MKKYFYSVLAASMLFACSQEEIVDVTKGEGQKVTFKVEIPEVSQSRAINLDGKEITIGTGQLATRLIYAQYEHGTRELETTTTPLVAGIVDDTDGTFEVNLTMAKDITYDVLFMAYNPGNNIFGISSEIDTPEEAKTVDLRRLTLKSSLHANQEAYDAFIGRLNNQGINAENKTVELKRPFAQVNAATTIEDLEAVKTLQAEVDSSLFKIYGAPNTLDVFTGGVSGQQDLIYKKADILKMYNKREYPYNEKFNDEYYYLTMAYVLANEKATYDADFEFYRKNSDNPVSHLNSVQSMPIEANFRTNILGTLLTKTDAYTITIDAGFGGNYTESDGIKTKSITVTSAEEFETAFTNSENDIIVLGDDINLNDLQSRTATDPTFTIPNDKTLTIDLNGKKLSATSTQSSGNYDMILVKGNLTVKNGTIETKHEGTNMGRNHMTTIFDVTAGGVLNLEGVTATNRGGSDMGFVAHLNNWGEVTLNVENCTLESNYVPVRVFNTGNDMNNVTIKNSTLKGSSAAFWVHNYTVADFGTEAKAEAQKALLNLNIYNQGNTFSPDVNGICYGFTNEVRADAYGITKSVSEDGTVVTLGSVIEEGLVRRGVAGAEENTTIKKAIVGEGVTTLYDRTFRRFYALETVELPSTLTTIGAAGSGVFQSCTALKNIVIPESVTVLGKGTFSECSSLESINIPAGVTRIEAEALRATGLKSVEFHAGVTYFGAQAFRDCKQLKEVIINAPVFTVEANAFGVMSGTLPGTTIYVANAKMKAYLESTLAYKNQFTIVAPGEATTTEELKDALAKGAKIINVAAGEYTFPASSVKAGQTINCAEGTVFTGKSSLDVKGATIVGATFKNENGVAVSGIINGTFKNCTFDSEEALRWCYTTAGQTVVFENCVIKTDFRGFHFDDMNGDVIFKNCEINGFNAYGGDGTATFEGCTFGNDQSAYNGLNIYSNTNLKNCTFTYVSDKTNFIDMEGTNKTLIIENCTATLDGAAADIKNFVGGSKLAENTVKIDGQLLLSN